MSMETHVIKEIQPGVFYTLLDFPKPTIVLDLLSDSYQWVLRSNHAVGDYSWKKYNLPVRGAEGNADVFSRIVEYDLLIETEKFRELYSDTGSIFLAQFRNFPQKHLDLKKIEGKQRYRLLTELEWNFVCDIPGARDYAPIESPHRQLVEKAIELTISDD